MGSDLNVLSRRIICFLVLAGRAAEVQTRLHQSFPGQTARAGAKDTREEGAGTFGRPAVESCSQAEESPQGPIHLVERYMPASTPPHVSHPLYCPLSHCSCSGCLPREQSHTHRHKTKSNGGLVSASVRCFSRLMQIFLH